MSGGAALDLALELASLDEGIDHLQYLTLLGGIGLLHGQQSAAQQSTKKRKRQTNADFPSREFAKENVLGWARTLPGCTRCGVEDRGGFPLCAQASQDLIPFQATVCLDRMLANQFGRPTLRWLTTLIMHSDLIKFAAAGAGLYSAWLW